MRNLFIGVLILALFVLLVLAVAPVYAARVPADYAGEGFYTNCPGPVITMLDEDGGVMVYCTLWGRHCSDEVKIWDDGTPYIRILCDNGKPTPEPPVGPPPQGGK